MQDLMGQITERIQDIVDDLDPGMRVMIHTTERCGCKEYNGAPPKLGAYQTTSCHICNDKGFLTDAKTFLPPEAYNEHGI